MARDGYRRSREEGPRIPPGGGDSTPLHEIDSFCASLDSETSAAGVFKDLDGQRKERRAAWRRSIDQSDQTLRQLSELHEKARIDLQPKDPIRRSLRKLKASRSKKRNALEKSVLSGCHCLVKLVALKELCRREVPDGDSLLQKVDDAIEAREKSHRDPLCVFPRRPVPCLPSYNKIPDRPREPYRQ